MKLACLKWTLFSIKYLEGFYSGFVCAKPPSSHASPYTYSEEFYAVFFFLFKYILLFLIIKQCFFLFRLPWASSSLWLSSCLDWGQQASLSTQPIEGRWPLWAMMFLLFLLCHSVSYIKINPKNYHPPTCKRSACVCWLRFFFPWAVPFPPACVHLMPIHFSFRWAASSSPICKHSPRLVGFLRQPFSSSSLCSWVANGGSSVAGRADHGAK